MCHEEDNIEVDYEDKVEQYDGDEIMSENTLPQLTARLLKMNNSKLTNNDNSMIDKDNINNVSKFCLNQE